MQASQSNSPHVPHKVSPDCIFSYELKTNCQAALAFKKAYVTLRAWVWSVVLGILSLAVFVFQTMLALACSPKSDPGEFCTRTYRSDVQTRQVYAYVTFSKSVYAAVFYVQAYGASGLQALHSLQPLQPGGRQLDHQGNCIGFMQSLAMATSRAVMQ